MWTTAKGFTAVAPGKDASVRTFQRFSSPAGPARTSGWCERAVGVPPHVYLRDVRLPKAAELLARGEKIVMVAMDTGFCDQSHFHKAFKSNFGVTPRPRRLDSLSVVYWEEYWYP